MKEYPMKCGARVAIGVAGGYLLGRTRKMKLALMLSGLVAGRRASGPGGLLGQATKLLGESPEVARLGGELRGRLVEAGKGAAIAVAARQVDALAERLSQRVGSLTDLATAAGEPRDSAQSPAAQDSDDSARPDGAQPDGHRPATKETSADEETRAETTRRSPARARTSGSATGGAATRKRSTRAAGTTARAGAGRPGGRPARGNRSSGDD
jgi:hypothetical protein